jgi:hypothetical protein
MNCFNSLDKLYLVDRITLLFYEKVENQKLETYLDKI